MASRSRLQGLHRRQALQSLLTPTIPAIPAIPATFITLKAEEASTQALAEDACSAKALFRRGQVYENSGGGEMKNSLRP